MFRTWRRSRPFWGGLLLLLAGLEMLLIPVSGVLMRGQIKLVIYVGVGGIFGILIGALLIACGLALWYNHANKTFYSIAGVLLSILSFIGTNLGGFFIGMLLGIVGGSLAFAWTPTDQAPADDFRPRPPGPRSEGVGLVLGEDRPDDDTLAYDRSRDDDPGDEAPADQPARGRDGTQRDSQPGGATDGTRGGRPYLGAPTGPRHHGRGGSRAIALAAMAALAAGTLFSLSGGQASAAETAPAQSQGSQGCILFVICTPSPSSSPTPSPAPPSSGGGGGSGSGGSGGSGTIPVVGGILPTTGSASPGASSGPGAKGKKNAANKNKKASATAGLVVSSSTTVLTASSATLNGLSYQGVVNMPTATGTVQMMKFTMSSQSLTTATQTATDPGHTLTTKLSSATFSGSVVLYATKLSGTLLGVPITLSPGNVVSTLLQLLNTLTPLVPVTMTNVTADQPVVLANSVVINGLGVSAS
jgi:Family of unknown function (DUF6114)